MTLSAAARLNKGKSGERELFNLLNEHLGTSIVRNLQQSQNGGCDSLTGDDFPFAIEVKRQETLNLKAWWQQTVTQAEKINKTPVLAYRPSRKPWKFLVPVNFLYGTTDRPSTIEWTAELHLDSFCEVVRENL